jgi:hypothetical protein
MGAGAGRSLPAAGPDGSVEGAGAPSAAGRPTGRTTAGGRSSGASRPSVGGASGGILRGMNQPPPPAVPLSADAVVGASMVCLASNISRSVCALPGPEGACFPPADGSPFRFRPMRPHSTRSVPPRADTSAAYPEIRVFDLSIPLGCIALLSTRTGRLRLIPDVNRSRPYRPSPYTQVPPCSPGSHAGG